MMRILVSFLLVFFSLQFYAQQQKTITVKRITNAPVIDGVLDDDVWKDTQAYGDFNMLQPGTEGSIRPGFETEIKMAYDDKAVYIAAYLYDPAPDSINSQFSQRDDFGAQADLFYFGINTYNDGINETRFAITSAGTIGDTRVSQNNEDRGFNVVFQGRKTQDAKGWYAEFKLPYNALRFPEVDIQDWSINFYREIKRINEVHSFSPIDITKGRQTQYNAIIYGVENIKPPVRLTLFPFGQAVVTQFEGETITNLSAGMDIKYGLSDSFTLDATLIPDFGQAAFDEVRLNLGPFEQTFQEQRQFFTEGTELFNKGRLFFSRRIGNAPTGGIGILGEDETVTLAPSRVNLLNAVKISGRTKQNLGVGFLNAITENTFAEITTVFSTNDTQGNPVIDSTRVREQLVEPLTNYNVFVLDQQFNGNSSISIINTNVTRDGDFRDGNATGFVFDVSDKENRFNTSGRAIMSNNNLASGRTLGFLSEFDFASTKGKFRYRVGHDFSNTTYDINDLGLSFRNNFNNFVAGVSYEIFEPTEIFNKYRFRLTARHSRLYQPDVVTGSRIDFGSFYALKSRLAFGFDAGYETERDDYFEPRVDGRFVTFPATMYANGFISTDYRKKFAIDVRGGFGNSIDNPENQQFINVSPRYRFSNKLLVILRSQFSLRNNQFGYVANTDTDVFFGQRDINAIENSISASYNFDPYKAIDLRFRNFWTTVDYSDDRFFNLNDDGTRNEVDYDISNNDPNTNFNIWNLDLSYRWRFAPGSEASLLYRNQIFNSDSKSTIGYTESLSNLFEQDIQHTVSLRITYFIDYNNVKYLFKKNS